MELITDVITSGKICNNEQVLNIAYGIDRNFLFGAAISMQSVVMHNKKIALRFHLFTDYLDADYLNKLDSFTQKNKNVEVCVYKVSRVFIDIFPSLKQWSYATFFRFAAFEYLSDKISHLLYIDADVVCKGPLDGLLNISFDDDKYAAVIKDVPFMQDKPAKRLGVDGLPGMYFNAGVVFLRLNAWRLNRFMNKAIEMLRSDPELNKFKCLDQDILNILFFGHCIFISGEYDCFYGIDYELKNQANETYQTFITENTKLIHYVGVTKPWNNWTNYPCQKYFNDAYQISCWNDVPFMPATDENQYYFKYRHAIKNNKYISATLSYLEYFRRKISRKYFNKK